MKTTGSIVTKITLGLAVAVSVAACNNNKPAAAVATTSTSTTTSDKGTTVYINLDTLSTQYNYAKDVQDRINAKIKANDDEKKSKGLAFQRDVAEYQKDVATMPADKRQVNEQRLQREQGELQQFEQSGNIDLQKFSNDETTKLYKKITEFAKAYAKEKGYKLVLTYSKSAPGVLYVDPSFDVTADVVKQLNDEYSKDKK